MAAEAGNEMIWEWNPNKNRVKRYGNYDELLGKDAQKMLKLDPERWFNRIHPDDIEGFKQSLVESLNDPKEKVWRHEYRIFNKHNEYAFILDRGMIVRDANGKAQRVVGAALDVSDSRKMINEITDQNERLRKIAWTQSHKVRAPLARAMGLINLLKEGDYDPMPQDEIISHIERSFAELDDIIKEITDATYIDSSS